MSKPLKSILLEDKSLATLIEQIIVNGLVGFLFWYEVNWSCKGISQKKIHEHITPLSNQKSVLKFRISSSDHGPHIKHFLGMSQTISMRYSSMGIGSWT